MGKVEKVFVMLLCMNLFLFLYFPLVFEGENAQQKSLLSKFMNVDTNSIEGTDISGDLAGMTLESDDAVVGDSTLSLVSPFRMVWNGIKGILTFLFAPIFIISTIPNIPSTVILIFALPNILLLLFGTISFIKGYDW